MKATETPIEQSLLIKLIALKYNGSQFYLKFLKREIQSELFSEKNSL